MKVLFEINKLNDNVDIIIHNTKPGHLWKLLGMHNISAIISVSAENLVDILKLINNALFPSETLQMCAVCHDGFEMLEM